MKTDNSFHGGDRVPDFAPTRTVSDFSAACFVAARSPGDRTQLAHASVEHRLAQPRELTRGPTPRDFLILTLKVFGR